MRVAVALRVVCALAWVGGVFSACDTGAVGVEDCREIERARCDAARFCDMRIESNEDVEACKRFARDHCLHGFEVAETPSSTELRRCVDAIEAAGTCAGEQGPDTSAPACAGLGSVGATRTACDVVATPELAPQCQFLVAEPPEEPEPDAGESAPETPTADAGQGDAG